MSRTRHHSDKHGEIQPSAEEGSAQAYKNKAYGYEYWSRRGPAGGMLPGRESKIRTHRRERRMKKRETDQQMDEFEG